MPYRYIDEVLADIFSELRAENHLRGLPLKRFASRAAYYSGPLNMAHAFREGNGRTQRIFLDQLAALAGYTLYGKKYREKRWLPHVEALASESLFTRA